ncbi:MAG: hypothetical protein ACTSO9_06535 [Candidatus Helarchaeota archaeon]
MVKSYLSGATGFVFFGAAGLILTALNYLFPLNFGIFDFMFWIYFSLFGQVITISPAAEALFAIWNCLWIFLIGIGCISAKDDTNAAIVPIIIGCVAILLILIAGIGNALKNQNFIDNYKLGVTLAAFMIKDPDTPSAAIGYLTLGGMLFGGSPAGGVYVPIEMISKYVIAVFFILVAVTFFNVDNKGYPDSYKIFPGVLLIIYACTIVIFGILPFIMGTPSTSGAAQAMGIVFGIFGTIEAVLVYLIPIFGVMIFVLINLDNQ